MGRQTQPPPRPPNTGDNAAGYLAAVLLVLPPVKAAVFIVVQQALFGLYLGCSFAPNHKGMPMLAADDQTDFLRRQVLTARNVRGNWRSYAQAIRHLHDVGRPLRANPAG